MAKPIIVELSVHGGVVSPVRIPPGVGIVVIDYDVEGYGSEDLWVDAETGGWYRKTKVSSKGEQTIKPPYKKSAARIIEAESHA